MNDEEHPSKPLQVVMLTVSEDARKAVEAMIDGAKKFFADDGEVPSAVTVVTEDRQPNVFPIIHHNDIEKYCMWAFVRFLRETHPIVMMVSEIWASKCEKGQDPFAMPRPSQDPKRTEFVMIAFWERGRTMWITAKIDRKTNTLGEFAVAFDTNDEGCSVAGELAKGKHYKGKERYGQR